MKITGLRKLYQAMGRPGAPLVRTVRRLLGVEDSASAQKFLELSEFTRRLGLNSITIVVSFDCDTPLDARAALKLLPELDRRGVPATFAVPGAMLRQAADDYRRISQAGGRFINHGAQPHAEFRNGQYAGITFYNEMSEAAVADDIRIGHAILADVTGVTARGFRSPHFGYFQAPSQRALVYSVARELGYEFCSDTLPELGLRKGPVFRTDGLCEIPLTGSIGAVDTILDSWGYLADFQNYRLKDEYFVAFAKTIDFFAARRLPTVLNYYVDPAHVVANDVFLNAIDYARDKGARFVDFPALLSSIKS